MDWKQVYATATDFERQQFAFMVLKNLQKYPPMPELQYHFIGARYKNKKTQILYLGIFVFILLTLSLGAWLVALNVPPAYGVPCVLFWFIVIFIIFCMRPARHTRWA